MALSSWARASLRYRIARPLLMASQIPRKKEDSTPRRGFGSGQRWRARAGRPDSFLKAGQWAS